MKDPVTFANNMAIAAQEWQQIVQELMQSPMHEDGLHQQDDLLQISQIFMEGIAALMSDPKRMLEMQYGLWQNYLNLWQQSTQRFLGTPLPEGSAAERGDRRFQDDSWQESAIFNFIKQSYLISASWLQDTMHEAGNDNPELAKKLDFYTRQYVDAIAPSNFMITNPEVLRMTLDSNGENLVRGLRNMREDIQRGGGKLRIRMTDEDAFELGKNIATTPGKVVFQNDLMQLIQYTPTTKEAYAVPVLLIPAWINKYYILDLQEKNSLVRWLVDQGYTVFCISWVNPDEKQREKTFDDYLTEGTLAALDAIEKATGSKHVSAVGYCLGGTLLAITQAYLAATKQASRITSCTYLTTMIDFADPGELGVFVDEEQLDALDRKMSTKGYLAETEMANTFNMLRANDLIWSFVINNYLLGKDPFPFDLLYWNSDSTRMPAAMHSFYMRNMYLDNKLREPGGISICGVPIDLGKIKTPSYILACREDHIAPWQSTYAATSLYGGPVTFTLAASGHIAGVINPPAKHKYCHWVFDGKTKKLPANPSDWQAKASEHAGSWWPHWHTWQQGFNAEQIKAPVPGKGKLKAIENAPGSYVKMR